MIRLDRIVKDLGGRRVVDEVSLDIHPGAITALIGPSGGGKTTVARCTVGLESIDAGGIDVEGVRLGPGHSPWDPAPTRVRQKIGMVFQDLRLWPYRTALDNLLEGPVVIKRMARGDALTVVRRWASLLGVESVLSKYPAALSGGERQRIAIARAMAMDPGYLVLDEITSALDPVTAGNVSDVLITLREQGVGLLLISHQIEFVRRCADAVHFVARGRVIEHGPAGVLERPQSEELDGFLREIRQGW